ncbi:MAG: multidrug transporter ATP-binding protein [Pseudonocardiales bacterium]|nr:multidrug transporter ATP-binding protein [Pseudonocardiales bacterium]
MIEARRLTKRYGSTLAVDDLSFDVLPGRVTGFLGPNGAGKSTTMRMVLGLDRPTSGTVTVLGRPFGEHHRPLHEIGAVLESRSVHGGRSAYNHLLCLAQSNGIAERRVHDVLELVGLSDVAGRRARAFSLGMSQRLGLAAALLGDPAVVLCDEPVNGLDPEGIRWIRTTLRALAAEGRTVFVSSHLMSEMALMADHVIVVGRGRLLADASMADLLASGARSFALVRTPDATRLAAVLHKAGATTSAHADGGLEVVGLPCDRIGDLAAEHGLRVHELTPRQASLEAAFLELTHDSVDFRVEEAS